MPSATVTTVTPAITGKLLISGVPTARAFDSMSLPSGRPEAMSTDVGTTTAMISGGCTMGPKTPRLRATRTATREPTTKQA